ncbi:MAG TPA: hypothetical protein P5250_08735, partial [Bacteroidales bacterium]|nr:hypothetical protein [Bacteroidales bacterium]
MIVIFIIAILTCINYNGFPQIGVAINTTGTSADSSAILDLSSKNSGFLLLRLSTAEHNAIINPVEVLQSWIGENINYNSTNSWCYYNDLG